MEVIRRRTSIFALLGIVAAFMLVAACGGDDSAEPAPAPAEAEGDLKIGLALFGGQTEPGYYEQMAQGSAQAAANVGADLTIIDNMGVGGESQQEQINGFTNLANAGNELIIVDATLAPAAAAAAAQHPDVVFYLWFTPIPEGATPNVYAISPQTSFLIYAEGILANHLSKTGKVAFIQGFPDVPGRVASDSFKLAAESEADGPEFSEGIVGDYSDPVKGKETAAALIANGVDVISAYGDGSIAGFIEAVEGTDTAIFLPASDRCSLSPNVAGAALWDTGIAIDTMVQQFVNDELPDPPVAVFMGLEREGSLILLLCPGYDTEENQAIVDQVLADLASGAVVLPESITSAG